MVVPNPTCIQVLCLTRDRRRRRDEADDWGASISARGWRPLGSKIIFHFLTCAGDPSGLLTLRLNACRCVDLACAARSEMLLSSRVSRILYHQPHKWLRVFCALFRCGGFGQRPDGWGRPPQRYGPPRLYENHAEVSVAITRTAGPL
jgi:hypothetical protein